MFETYLSRYNKVKWLHLNIIQNMKITLTDGNNFINLEVDPDQLIEDVKALLESETGIPMNQLELYTDGQPLKDNETLAQRKISEGGLIYYVVSQKPANKPKKGLGLADMIKTFDKQSKKITEAGFEFSTRRVEEFIPEAKRLIEEMSSDPYRLAELSSNHPDVAQAIEKRDVNKLAAIMHKKNEEKIKELKQKERKFIQLSKDPMNPEYQRLLEERINQDNIDKNHEFANQYIPEVFGHITMLYIRSSINKIPIQAFVDSGAQSTIMSQSLAERCGYPSIQLRLTRLIDKRYAGKAIGVGSCKIIGRIHAADIEIEGKFLTCSFTVIENNSTQFLLGLDMLRRFNCIIDLKKNTLTFQDGIIVTNFLSDGEVEKNRAPASKEDIEKKMKKLIDMGFSKADAFEALRESGFNEEVASNMLMQKKYGK